MIIDKFRAETQSKQMTVSRRYFTLLSVAACAGISVPAAAHRERVTLTEVEWNPFKNRLYVTHSFHVHEAERTLYKAGVISKPDLYSLKSRAELALYTGDNFSLSNLDGAPIPLEIIGAEIVGRECMVYQDAALEQLPAGFTIECNLMRDFDGGQINNVDVKVTQQVQSLSFRGDDGIKSVSL